MLVPVESGIRFPGTGLAVDRHRLDAAADAVRVQHRDLVDDAAVAARDVERAPALRDAGVDPQPVVVGLHAEDALGGHDEAPRRGPGQPRVAGLARDRRVAPGDHLGVDVRLVPVGLDPVFLRRRADREVVVHRAVALAEQAPREVDPGVGVAEDARVLLVAGRIAGDLAELRVVAGERGLVEDDAVLGVEALVHALERLPGAAVPGPGAAEHAPALALDEDRALLALVRADRAPLGVERPQVPVAVPGVLLDRGEHLVVGAPQARLVRRAGPGAGTGRPARGSA